MSSKRDYNRCVKLIKEINELIVDEREPEAEPLLDELGQLRPTLDEFHNKVVGRLVHSLCFSDGIDVEIDEASPGSHAHWN